MMALDDELLEEVSGGVINYSNTANDLKEGSIFMAEGYSSFYRLVAIVGDSMNCQDIKSKSFLSIPVDVKVKVIR